MNLGKIHENLFLGILAAVASIPSSLSITKDYIFPMIKGELEKVPSGQAILFLLSTLLFFTSIAWIKEIIEDMDRTSRFMNQKQFNKFMIKTVIMGIVAIISGLMTNKILFE